MGNILPIRPSPSKSELQGTAITEGCLRFFLLADHLVPRGGVVVRWIRRHTSVSPFSGFPLKPHYPLHWGSFPGGLMTYWLPSSP